MTDRTATDRPIKEQPKVFTYPLALKLVYRYGNIAATFTLALYLVPLIAGASEHSEYTFYALAVGIMIVAINWWFVKLYAVTPYRVEADEEKLVGSSYVFRSKRVEIRFADVVDLKGGIFEGRPYGLMKVIDKEGATIAFFHRIRRSKELQGEILRLVPRKVYDDVLDKLGMRKDKIRKKASKRR
ncbi:MAG: hypothetical protein GF419_00895 [Ignavibacteriales bacterium]|nr:hypothetical protein [Ignavibacteriales bacterium]